jgi:hypothetical protein
MARPATGQTPPMSFRPPEPLANAARKKAKAEGRTMTDVLISLLHHYVSSPAKPREHAPPTAE